MANYYFVKNRKQRVKEAEQRLIPFDGTGAAKRGRPDLGRATPACGSSLVWFQFSLTTPAGHRVFIKKLQRIQQILREQKKKTRA